MSPPRSVIHVFAARQAWKYSSSVDSAGAPTAVVTPPGAWPTEPGAAVCVSNDVVGVDEPDPLGGACDDDGPESEPPEHPATRQALTATTAIETRVGWLRMWSIYATLGAVIEWTCRQECCRA